MAESYKISSGDSVCVLITTSDEEKCIPVEKSYKKAMTVMDLKHQLAFMTGASHETMSIKVYDGDNYLYFLDNDNALLGSYHLDNGMRLHIEDAFSLKKSLEDESNAEKYMMSPEEYSKRDENHVDGTSVVGQSALVRTSRGRGLIRNRSSIERLNAVEVKPLRRPVIQPEELICPESSMRMNKGLSSSTTAVSTLPSINDNDVENRMASLTVQNDNKTFNISEESNLNPNAEEFIPSFIKQNYESSPRKSEIEIVDPSTGQPVSLDDCGDDVIFGRDEFSDDDMSICNVIQTVSAAALKIENYSPSDIKYEKEVCDVLELVENLLTSSPGLFSSIITALNDIFLRWVGFDTTLTAVANKIVEQSISNNNYAYFGAKFCTSLDKITASVGRKPPFRYFVLQECEVMHNQLQSLIGEEDCEKAHNIIMFFAELFIQLDVAGKSRISALGVGLIKSLELLLDRPTSDNVRCLCKILKLSGWALDDDHKDLMATLINNLKRSKSVNAFDTPTVNILNSVINLATLSWGRNSNNNSSSNATTPVSPQVTGNNFRFNSNYARVAGNTYGPDGELLTEEESEFLDDSCKFLPDYEDDRDEYGGFNYDNEEVVSDGMDEEAFDAFEQFLLTVPKTNSRNIVNHVRK